MDLPVSAQEGFVSFRGYRVWYRVVGDRDEPGRLPLLCLHGGPGAAHDYLEPLEVMAATGRRVIFYDQLGCGNSDHPHEPSMWMVDLFVEEVGVVRRALGLERLHILGQSWGGMLGMEYALTQPAGLASLIVADSPASISQWISEANRLRAELPPEVQQTLLKHEDAGTTDSPEYQEAMLVFLVIGGRYDEATPAITETVHRGILGSEWVIFEHSSHMPHVEEPERYMDVLDQFLSRVEAQA